MYALCAIFLIKNIKFLLKYQIKKKYLVKKRYFIVAEVDLLHKNKTCFI